MAITTTLRHVDAQTHFRHRWRDCSRDTRDSSDINREKVQMVFRNTPPISYELQI